MTAVDENKDRPFAITLDVGSSLENETGSWRSERPIYVDLLPPCNKQCPAGENIQQWLYHTEEGDYEAAWREIMVNNPLPAVMGRVCYHTCQVACNRAKVDEAVGINAVERFLGDKALTEGWEVPVTAEPSGKKVLVVGAGPSGISAAYHLARLGHSVTIRDEREKAGGMMRYGIPSYRLPRGILDGELNRIAKMGVTFEMSTQVQDLKSELDHFDAVFLAVGAQIGKEVTIPASDPKNVLDAVELLRQVEVRRENVDGVKPLAGRKVAVYGGGNTAIDAARSAVRLGAEETFIVYRRTRAQMPAHDFEVEEALEEGVQLVELRTVRQAMDGKLELEKMELDADGFPQPTGEHDELAADVLVFALGQEADLGLLSGIDGIEMERGVVKINNRMMTGHPGVFAGGDMVPRDKNVTAAIGHGKKAARNIDAWLRGEEYQEPAKPGDASLDRMTTWYYSDAPQQIREKLEGPRRWSTFDEVVQGLDEEGAVFEARRCMSCGNCFGCDNCYGVCPDNAVLKIKAGEYEFKYEYCKGCGVCAEECPCGAISMIPEEI
ncbi:MAG: NAD(P)-binding protein [Actinomycetaceae bacterium]|nr:NAD(P)-binding protein [Actinomycetaceae bacterium]MDY5855348.1 NAD(P)-binding protein [Arcanobacterium sp.]